MTKRNVQFVDAHQHTEAGFDFNPLHWTACFMQPAKLSDVRSWQQHIPFAFWLTEVLKPSCFVELGTHKGDSYLAFCQAVSALKLSTRCYAVDTWRGDEHAGLYDDSVYDELAAYHDAAYGGFSRLLRMTFDEAADNFADKSIDLLHIDGLHTYEAVKHDFQNWRAKLSDCAIVLFHDINVHENEFGVWRYWTELEKTYPSFAFRHGNGLGVLAASRSCPEAVAPLFSLPESGAGAIRQLFHSLGSRAQGNAAGEALAAKRHTVLLEGVRALDAVLDQHGLEHDPLPADPNEHELGRHLIWTHRALAKLSKELHEANLAAHGFSSDSAQLRTEPDRLRAEEDAGKAAIRLQVLRDTMLSLDQALDASGIAHAAVPGNADEHALGRHAIWTHRGLAKLSQDVHERDQRIKTLTAQLEIERAIHSQGTLERSQLIEALKERMENDRLIFSRDAHQRDQQIEALKARLEEDRATFARDIGERDQIIHTLQEKLGALETSCSTFDAANEALRNEAAKTTTLLRNLHSTVNELMSSLHASGVHDAPTQEDGDNKNEIERSLAFTWHAVNDLAGHIHERNAKLRESEEAVHALGNDMARIRETLRITNQHAANLENQLGQLRRSLSWRASAPLRWIGKPFALLTSGRFEQHLYRAYYAMPGLSSARKRMFITWLHKRMGFLTRRTLSYRLFEQTENMVAAQIAARQAGEGTPPAEKRMDQQRADVLIATWENPPRISIVMPVYNIEEKWLVTAVDSVRNQFYPHWELCIVDDGSTRTDTVAAIDRLMRDRDSRIKVKRQKKNGGIASASDAALALASGDYTGLLDNDDLLTRDALLEMARRIVKEAPDVLYSDEDKLDENGFFVEPHFKPDYNEEYLQSINYICHFLVARTELLRKVGGFRPGFDGAQDYDLILRLTEATTKIAHIAMVLYHWRRIPGSTSATASAKPHTSKAGLQALAESMSRRNIDAQILSGPFPNTYRVKRRIQGSPLVSIIIPFRDKPALLETCVNSILAKTDYTNYEVLCIDNGSVEAATLQLLDELRRRDERVRVVRHDVPFNYSTINNFATTQARGTHFLFLNNDTEVIDAGWLEALLEHSQRPEVGVVGAKLLYADDTIQHAGVVVGMGGVAGHGHLFLPKDDPGYFSRAQLTQRLSAVTFACAMMRRDVFEEVRGLNEADLKIAFNDVDFCLRAREAGYEIIYTPYAVLYHYESKSRGYEDTVEKQARFGQEIRYMQERHAVALQAGDPFYNPNLTLFDNFKPDLSYVGKLPT